MEESKMRMRFLENGKKNMTYKVVISETYLEEIEEICQYINNKLKAKNASNIYKYYTYFLTKSKVHIGKENFKIMDFVFLNALMRSKTKKCYTIL